LQNKTQVFPLPGAGVFVHNRLTHSLEVASVGRSLGNMAGEFITENFKKDLSEESVNFYLYNLHNVIAAACLCHDIGNPAFGHSGEDAIAMYFAENQEIKNFINEKQWADLLNFEGNANAMRVLTHRQNGKDEGGLQLTFSTLASIAKYPCESLGKDKKSIYRKKFGFFQSEKNTFIEISEKTHIFCENDNPLIYRRHPFVWLVEAADDISYNIIDMEDAHRLGIISTEDCKNLFYDLIESIDGNMDRIDQKLAMLSDRNEKISYLRAKLINSLINRTIEIFKQNFQQILDGTLQKSLLDIFKENSKELQEIESFSIDKIYNHRAVLEIENAGYNVIHELLDHFIPSIIIDKNNRKKIDEKSVRLMPEQFLYESGSVYERILGVVDFISGMTDNYATALYRKIKGIDIGITI
jgi:dGTPase